MRSDDVAPPQYSMSRPTPPSLSSSHSFHHRATRCRYPGIHDHHVPDHYHCPLDCTTYYCSPSNDNDEHKYNHYATYYCIPSNNNDEYKYDHYADDDYDGYCAWRGAQSFN